MEVSTEHRKQCNLMEEHLYFKLSCKLRSCFKGVLETFQLRKYICKEKTAKTKQCKAFFIG